MHNNADRKARIEVFTSPTCPHCPHAWALAQEINRERDDVKIIELSTASKEGRRKADKYHIMSVPTIIIKGSFGEPIGLQGVPAKSSFNKAIDISLGIKEWEEPKSLWQSIKEKFFKHD